MARKPEAAPLAFDQAAERWRHLYRSAQEQQERQHAIVADPLRSADDRRQALKLYGIRSLGTRDDGKDAERGVRPGVRERQRPGMLGLQRQVAEDQEQRSIVQTVPGDRAARAGGRLTLRHGLAQSVDIATLIGAHTRRIENGRLAPGLPAFRRVTRALGQEVVPSLAAGVTRFVCGKRRDDRVFGVQRRRVREDCETRNREKEIMR